MENHYQPEGGHFNARGASSTTATQSFSAFGDSGNHNRHHSPSPLRADARLDLVARAIERCTNDFSAGVFRLIEPEARLRWEHEHPHLAQERPHANWNFESYRLIARAVLADLDQIEVGLEQRTGAGGTPGHRVGATMSAPSGSSGAAANDDVDPQTLSAARARETTALPGPGELVQ